MQYSFTKVGPGAYRMPNYKSDENDDPLKISFELKPKSAFLESVINDSD